MGVNFVAASTQKIVVPYSAVFSGLSAMTITWWMDMDLDSSADFLCQKSGATIDWKIRYGAGGNNLTFYANAGGNYVRTATNSINPGGGTEYFCALVYDGSGAGNTGRARFYINNAYSYASDAGTIPASLNNNNYDLNIGGGEAGAEYYDGRLWHIRIYNAALTTTQLSNIYYNRGNDNIVTGLVGSWRMDEGGHGTNVATITDISGNNNDGTDTNNPTYYAVPMTII